MFVRCNRLLRWQSSWYYLEDTDRRVGEMVPSIVTVVHIDDSPEFWPAARGKKKEAAPKIPAGWKAVCASSSSVASGVGGSASSGGSGGHSTGGGHVSRLEMLMSADADVADLRRSG